MDFRKMPYERQIKELAPAKASFFEGDDFITVVSEKGVFRFKTKLEGSTPRRMIETRKVSSSQQYRLMFALGFEAIDSIAATWVRGNVTVRFVKSRIRLLVDNVSVRSVVVEVRDD